MAIESLAAALEQEHHDIDRGIEAFADGPVTRARDRQPLTSAIRALRRHIYLEEEFLFPPMSATGLIAPIFVMLREHAQMWQVLDSLERELDRERVLGRVAIIRSTGDAAVRAHSYPRSVGVRVPCGYELPLAS